MATASELKPQVKGRLAEMEQSIIELLRSGRESFRTTISCDAELALAAVRAAARENRDFSNFCAQALAEYSSQFSGPSSETAELLAKVATLVDGNPTVSAEVEKFLRELARAKRRSSQ
jgi:acyl-CoA reductase-like NAD-dependent aldehyde dehydrogenase